MLLELGKEAIQDLVIRYVLSMRDKAEKKYARSTVNTAVAAILYFFDNNDIELNRHKIKRYLPSDESTYHDEDRPYTLEEIQNILSLGCNDLRSKAIVLLLASSGIRLGALPSMQIGDLTETGFNGLNVYKIQVYARTPYKYYTFCTPECYKAISDYLD
jgi:integrase